MQNFTRQCKRNCLHLVTALYAAMREIPGKLHILVKMQDVWFVCPIHPSIHRAEIEHGASEHFRGASAELPQSFRKNTCRNTKNNVGCISRKHASFRMRFRISNFHNKTSNSKIRNVPLLLKNKQTILHEHHIYIYIYIYIYISHTCTVISR